MRQGVKYICKVKSSESDFIINDVALPINIGIMLIYNKNIRLLGVLLTTLFIPNGIKKTE